MNKFCSKCGKELDGNPQYCPSCGFQLINVNNNQGQKSKIVAFILALLFGALGMHNFYLGFYGKGISQLLLTVLTCGIGGIISGIWSLYEAVMILTGTIDKDFNGVYLRD